MLRWLDRLLLLCVSAIVVVSLLPLGARLWWVLDLTTHFRLQYLAVSLPLLALAALRRKRMAVAALLVASIVSALPVLPYVPVAAASTAEPLAARVKVLSVNVSYRQFSARRLLEIVASERPDVLLVVEFTPHAATVLADLDQLFPHSLKLPAEGPYGIALWSQLELDSTSEFQLGRVPAIEAQLRSPAGLVSLLGVHLSAPTFGRRAADRNEQLRLLAKRVETLRAPVIVAGDFNITPFSPFFVDWLESTALTDSRRSRSLSVSWPASLPIAGIPIDHVAVSREIAVISHRRLPDFNSDHFGILVELEIHSEQP